MNASSSACVTVTDDTISASGSIDIGCRIVRTMFVDAGKKFGKRVARGRGVEQQLRVDDVLVAVRIKRENAHAGAEFEIDHVNGGADADEQIGSAEGAGDGRKDDALLEVELGAGRVEERIHIGIRRPQRVLDVVARDRVAVDRLADEAVEGARIRRSEEPSPCGARCRDRRRLKTLRRCAGTFSTRPTDAGQRKTRAATLPPNGE